MNDTRLKDRIIQSLWRAADADANVVSATLAGSFVNAASLEGLSDIDFIVVVDRLDAAAFDALQRDFSEAVRPVLADAGYDFRLNATLGPLKFNAPKLAVLHLMPYSRAAHVEHVVNSPFTCLDWQRSPYFRKQSLSDVYPTFGLQPRHFLSARRSIADYLNDYRGRVVSYRELECDESGYRERKCHKPMDDRDRHEFAYHVMRFLMLNLLKLVRRCDARAATLEGLMDCFFELYPDGEPEARGLLSALADKKRRVDYADPIENLDARLERFVADFERQFRQDFIETATRHLTFRHAATEANTGPLRFLGRSDLPILDVEESAESLVKLRRAFEQVQPTRHFSSPLRRCLQSMGLAAGAEVAPEIDDRLVEMDYGRCELMTVGKCREEHGELFEAWGRREDPRFPGGENSADVTSRANAFAQEQWAACGPSTATCTHNVVLRSLVGHALGVPEHDRHRIAVPHLTPIEFVATRRFGLFVNLDESVERAMFAGFAAK